MVCLHGFVDTWRTWELVLPALERRHDVLAITLAGHAGGPPIDGEPGEAALVGPIEAAMDEAGFARAHLVGNSLGGYLALQLATRGPGADGRRARSGRRLGTGRRLLQGPPALPGRAARDGDERRAPRRGDPRHRGGPPPRDAPPDDVHLETAQLIPGFTA
jgi:pimeloyl-ACP methyl ester carboxylesterase